MKKIRTFLIELTLFSLLAPQAFLLIYHFPHFFRGGNRFGLLKALAAYALTISWVSAPVFAAMVLLFGMLARKGVRWYRLLAFCLAAGYFWAAAWNLLVFKTFAYGHAGFAILMCSLAVSGCAWACDFYRRSLLVVPVKKDAADLSE